MFPLDSLDWQDSHCPISHLSRSPQSLRMVYPSHSWGPSLDSKLFFPPFSIGRLITLFTVPPSPSDSCSSSPTDHYSPHSPYHEPVLHVICNIPLVAPKPLHYHDSHPTILQLDLSEVNEDLSHPPYTHRSPKRKHESDEDDSRLGQRRRRKLARTIISRRFDRTQR